MSVNGFIPYNADDSAFYLKVEEEGHLKSASISS